MRSMNKTLNELMEARTQIKEKLEEIEQFPDSDITEKPAGIFDIGIGNEEQLNQENVRF